VLMSATWQYGLLSLIVWIGGGIIHLGRSILQQGKDCCDLLMLLTDGLD
jgi:hypothetical protein